MHLPPPSPKVPRSSEPGNAVGSVFLSVICPRKSRSDTGGGIPEEGVPEPTPVLEAGRVGGPLGNLGPPTVFAELQMFPSATHTERRRHARVPFTVKGREFSRVPPS